MRLFSDLSERVSDPWLRRAFLLAENGRGTTSPNPIVGCVVVKDGQIVGEGFHERAGEPHAEVIALQSAGEAARGADVYVTLEPCCHTGRTGPCSSALTTAGVASVTVGMPDPNPEACGGADALRAAGIDVRFAEDPGPFEEQNEAWLMRVREGRPFVRVKVALTLDGRPSLRSTRRTMITGAGGAVVTMRLRSWADAVLVGASTFVVDDPALTVRTPEGEVVGRQPRRIVLARTAVPPSDATAFTDSNPSAIVVISDRAAAMARTALGPLGVEVDEYDYHGGLSAALKVLAGRDVTDLLVEPGPTLFSALWSAGLVDDLVLVHAGGLAGATAPPLFLGQAQAESDKLVRVMNALEAGVSGEDAITRWRPEWATR